MKHRLIAAASATGAATAVTGGAWAAGIHHSLLGAGLFLAAFVLLAHNTLAQLRQWRVSAGQVTR